MSNFLEENKDYLDKAVDYYYSTEEQEKYFGKKPKSRYYTFKYCYENIKAETILNDTIISYKF